MIAALAELAEALIQRAVRDVQSQGYRARDAWAWLMLPEEASDGTRSGWDLEDACAVLNVDPAILRKRLVAKGFGFPPKKIDPPVRLPRRDLPEGRPKVPGIIQCRTCGLPVPTGDVHTTRRCLACGKRFRARYLKLRGLLSAEDNTTTPRRTHVQAAMRLLLQRGPLPGRYVHTQLHRAGFAPKTIERAREALKPRITRTAEGYTLWALPENTGGVP